MMRPLACFFLAALMGGVLSGSAHADSKGIVVRVATDGSPVAGDSAALLTSEQGETAEIPLNDAGEPPDVNGEDGTFSGSAWLEGDAFSVSVRLGDTVHEAGRVSWGAEDAKRDLNVTIVGGLVTAEATVSNPSLPLTAGVPEGEPDPAMAKQPPKDGEISPQDTNNPGGPPIPGEDGNPPAVDGAGGGAEGAAARPPQALGTGPQPDAGSKGLMIAQLFGLALGIAVIIAMVKWWWQTGDDGLGGPLGLEPLAEPGLLGPGTPSLSEPVSVWGATAADISALVGPLLGTVARHRVVCMLAPATLAAPQVFGGPVYPTADTEEFHDALDALAAEGTELAVGFVVAEHLDAETLEGLVSGLPAGVGLVVLAVSPTAELPAPVSCRRDGARWVFAQGDTTVIAAVAANGLVPVPA